MNLKTPGAQLFIPDGVAETDALARTTCMGVSAHQDDLEIMSYHGIIECFQQTDKWYGGVVVTNGGGSPRADVYADYTDEQMMDVRAKEQKKAAVLGEYAFQALLHYPSSAVKDAGNPDVVAELKALFEAARPERIYTHNLADKHPTHVAVALRVIEACRQMAPETRPKEVWGGEVWRDLDWMADSDKVVLNCTSHEGLQAALLGVFDSQVCGGKRYDLATLGRRRAHATYHESHGVDQADLLNFAMDLSPLVHDPSLDIKSHVQGFIERFTASVTSSLDNVL